MNTTEQAVLDIYNQYYWIGDKCFDKNVVHVLIIVIVFLTVLFCGTILLIRRRNIK